VSHSLLLLGHRGARSIPGTLENSFAAFDLAMASGCDGFEFDVRLCSDGAAVVAHDSTIGGIEILSAPADNIPALPRVDAVLEKYAERAFLDIELKVQGSGAAAVTAIHKYLPQRCVISSFLPEVLCEVRGLDDSIALGFICDDSGKLPQWHGLACDYVIVHHRLASKDLIDAVHTSGRKLFVWTVNSPPLMHTLADSGVDGMISDDPALLCQTLR